MPRLGRVVSVVGVVLLLGCATKPDQDAGTKPEGPAVEEPDVAPTPPEPETSTEPEEPAAATEPVESTGAAAVAEAAEPVESVEPAGPEVPVEPVASAPAAPMVADTGELPDNPILRKAHSRYLSDRREAIGEFKALDEAAKRGLMPEVAGLLRKDNWLVQSAALKMLQEAGGLAKEGAPQLVEAFGAALGAKDAMLAREILKVLDKAGIETRDAVPTLIGILRGDDARSARSAAEFLAKMGSDAAPATPDLARALASDDAGLRVAAAEALKEIGAEAAPAAPALAEALKVDDDRLRKAVVEALAKLGDAARPAVDGLVGMLGAGDEGTVRQAAQALGGIGKPAAKSLPALLAAAGKAKGDTLEAIAKAVQSVKTQNKAPSGEPASATCAEGGEATVELSFADADDVDIVLKAEVAGGPKGGTAKVEGRNTIVYTSRPGFVGTDSFTWKVTDGQAESAPVAIRVTVTPDTRPAELKGVNATGDATRVTLSFDEPVDEGSASRPGAYKIAGARVQEAALGDDGMTVVLTTSALEEGRDYTLTAKGIRDRAAARNSGDYEATFTYIREMPGLAYEFYKGDWDKLPDFDKLEAAKTGAVGTFDIKVEKDDEQFAYRFRGVISVDAAGEYTFFTTSDDGSKLYVNGKELVDNDGLHGMDEKSGKVELEAGRHDIVVTMFEKSGGEGLEVQWQGPGVKKQKIPADRLSHVPSAGE